MSLIRTIRRMLSGHIPRLQPDAPARRLPPPVAPGTVALRPGAWQCIAKPGGMIVECLRGRIRLSQDDGPDALALDAGQHFRVLGNAPLYVEGAPAGKVRFSRGVALGRLV